MRRMNSATILPRPAAGDAAPYYFRYIDRVPDEDVLSLLERGLAETRRVLAGIVGAGGERETFRYEPGKWSVREVVGHVLDAERVFGFRALHMARGADTALPSLDEDEWVPTSGAGARPLAEMLDELELVRRGHLAMFRAFDAAAWERTGVASDVLFRVRAFPFILAGHEIHHREVLAERYAVAR
jgi:hypothetical protein